MGWFWNSPSSSKPSPTDAEPSPTTAQAPPPTSAASRPSPEPVDEMQKFLSMVQEEMVSSKPGGPSSAATPAEATPAEPSPPPITAAGRTPASQAISETLLPTEMSCRDAFDYAWHCHTPGAQWNAVYRYGSVRPCTELWDDFWFCMRTKGYKGESRANAIRDHFRAKENAKYGRGKPSSEDVWESRDEKVAPGTAFRERFDGPEESDSEWQLREMERRRILRERMGFDKES